MYLSVFFRVVFEYKGGDILRVENISLCPVTGFSIREEEYIKTDESCLVKILHTLIGIQADDADAAEEDFHMQYGYCTLGKIIETGNKIIKASPGDFILLPPIYKSYLFIHSMRRQLYPIIRKDIDMDNISKLFLPIICAALQNLEKIKECYEKGQKVFLHQNTLFNEIMKLLFQQHEMEYVEDKKAWDDRMLVKPTHHVIMMGKEGHTIDYMKLIKNTESADRHIYEIPIFSILFHQYMSYDNLACAIAFMKDNEICMDGIIAQHVHAEHILQINHSLKEHEFHGKCLVYDW